jgi:hypothetical protein
MGTTCTASNAVYGVFSANEAAQATPTRQFSIHGGSPLWIATMRWIR